MFTVCGACTHLCFESLTPLSVSFSVVCHFSIQPILSPRLLDAHTSQSRRTFKIHSLFVIVCTRLIHTVTAFVIVWHFKAQSNFSQIRKFCRGRETSLVPVALISFISIVVYIIYGLLQLNLRVIAHPDRLVRFI